MEDEVCIWHRGIDIVEYVHSDGGGKICGGVLAFCLSVKFWPFHRDHTSPYLSIISTTQHATTYSGKVMTAMPVR